MYDLRQFAQSNRCLQKLVIESRQDLSADQVDSLHGAITAIRLKHLCIKNSRFARDGSLERILADCANVEKMFIRCNPISENSAFSRLLCDSTTILQYLNVSSYYLKELNNEERRKCMSWVSSSLEGNTTLKRLELESVRQFEDELICFCKLLCDTPSFRNIYNSNQQLNRFMV
jgi:hypothetical protein